MNHDIGVDSTARNGEIFQVEAVTLDVLAIAGRVIDAAHQGRGDGPCDQGQREDSREQQHPSAAGEGEQARAAWTRRIHRGDAEAAEESAVVNSHLRSAFSAPPW